MVEEHAIILGSHATEQSRPESNADQNLQNDERYSPLQSREAQQDDGKCDEDERLDQKYH